MKLKELHINSAEQGTFEWRKARLGKFTASKIADIMAKGRGKDQVFGQTAISAIAEVAGERELAPEYLNDEDKFQYWSDLQCRTNAQMRFGSENESFARTRYEIETGLDVQEVGLIDSSDTPYLASSPDGIVMKGQTVEGIIEIKSPQNKNYKLYMWMIKDSETLKATNATYYWQVMTNLAVTGAKWADFVIYSPFHLDGVKIVRIERNEDDIATIKERVTLANHFIDTMNNGGADTNASA